MRLPIRPRGLAAVAALTLALVTGAGTAHAVAAGPGDPPPFIAPFGTVSEVASTVPGNGDVNPYGTVVIPESAGELHQGNVLVSNFNDMMNHQGTGTTLVQVSPGGQVEQFAQIDPTGLPGSCPGGVGLTTALTVLPGGWVVVGSLPTSDGTSATMQAGCLLVLDEHGTVRETLAGNGINGPWDLTSVSHGDLTQLFVTNVLNGTVAASPNVVNGGTVLRLTLRTGPGDQPPQWIHTTRIGSGFGERTDSNALVVGPTGVGLGRDGKLYVADTLGNRITEIPRAETRDSDDGTGRQVSIADHLNGPLGLAIAPNGDILTVNGGDGFIVETDPCGKQVASQLLDSQGAPPPPGGGGALFGLAVAPDGQGVYFVDDNENQLNLLH
ncbi:hypothetical protein [Kitasatospora sp. LaBMicrA B282]|uniref:hypothetical protein n=1 Tax=Kitasatospora sp. LaBMicrA B282 TaxID=3420949 RepID=UPI003D0A5174